MQDLPHIETEVIECFITESYKKKTEIFCFFSYKYVLEEQVAG